MSAIVVVFEDEEEAQRTVAELARAGLGEIRARILDSSEPLSYGNQSGNPPMVDPIMGSLEVRPSEPPEIPEANLTGESGEYSSSVPVTGEETRGVQVMIEFDSHNEEKVRKILAGKKGPSQEQVGE